MEKKELRGLMHEVYSLLIEVEKTHRYSMSKIYGLYNKVFEKNEEAQSCASCLIRKVRELREWYSNAKEKYAEMPAEEETSSSSDNREVVNYKENTYLTEEMKDSIVKSEKVAKTRKKKVL